MAVNFEIVWNTTHGQPLIHRELLTAANAGIPQHVCSVPADGVRGWRNCDTNLRDWWRSHRAEVAAPWVLFLEWDVAATADLTTMIRKPKRGVGLVCAQLYSAVAHRRTWPPFGEVPRLPRELREIAVGCVPNAVLLVSREAMDAVCDPRWDDVFAADILSELRLGTVLRACGFQVAAEALWKGVGTVPLPGIGQEPGIYHPLKMEVSR